MIFTTPIAFTFLSIVTIAVFPEQATTSAMLASGENSAIEIAHGVTGSEIESCFTVKAKKYTVEISDTIPEIVEQHNALTDKMIFLPDSIKTFRQLLSEFKGHTVLLDMWGTWCGPCRKEMNNNSAALKEYFAGQDLMFLYVANYDMNKEKLWKELIAFFKLEGYHLLAKPNITNDIMNRIKSNEYPTYVIIDKNGKFEKSRAGYPMKRDVLIKQIEEALKR